MQQLSESMTRVREDVSSVKRASERAEKMRMMDSPAAIQRLSDRVDKIQNDVALIVEMLQANKNRN